MKKSLAFILSLCMILMLTACGQQKPVAEEVAPEATEEVSTEEVAEVEYSERVFRVGTNNSSPHPLVQGLEQFSAILSEKTGGKMSIEIYDGGQLGDKATQMQMVQTGALDFYTCASGTLADYGAPDVAVYNLPYLFDNVDQARAAMNSDVAKELIQYIDDCDIDMIALGSYVESGRCWFTSVEVTASPSSLAGLKLRSQDGTIYAKTAEAFGVSTQSVAFSELYSAIQTGIVDGADQPVSGYASNSFQEVSKYYIKDEHEIAPAFVLCSEDTWNSLSDVEKAVVQEAFDESVVKFTEIANAKDAEYYDMIKEAGVNVIEVNPQEWKDVVAPIYEEYPEWSDYITALRAVEY